MTEFDQLRIPRNLKIKMKLAFFYVVDLMVVGGIFFLSFYANEYLFHLPQSNYMMLQGINIVFGIYLCMGASNTNMKNYQVIMRIFLCDKNKYIS